MVGVTMEEVDSVTVVVDSEGTTAADLVAVDSGVVSEVTEVSEVTVVTAMANLTATAIATLTATATAASEDSWAFFSATNATAHSKQKARNRPTNLINRMEPHTSQCPQNSMKHFYY